MIRLAVRCRPELAEHVLAELTVLAPNGVEEDSGPGYVEYAIYGGEGELPELGELEVAAGDGLVEVVSTSVPDDWADRWQDFHKPLLVGERIWLRPSWEPPREGALDVVVDPGRAFGTGAHPTTRLCLEYLLELEEAGEAQRSSRRPRRRLRRPRDSRRKAGLGPGRRLRPRARVDRSFKGQCSRSTTSTPSFELLNLRDRLPELAPTVVANMTTPVLKAVASLLASDEAERGRTRRSLPAVAPTSPSPLPATLACSGILPPELDEVAAAFEPCGLAEADRRIDGDWAALLLRRR